MSESSEARTKRLHALELTTAIRAALDTYNPQTVDEVRWLLDGMIEQAAKVPA